MIITVAGRNERHERQIEFQAMLHGLDTVTCKDGLEIVCHRPEQMLHVIKEAGGTIVRQDKRLPLRRQDTTL
jgi:hypothetical protein